MQAETPPSYPDTPGVRLLPPFVYLAGLTAGLLVEIFLPLGWRVGIPGMLAAMLLIFSGAILVATSFKHFLRAGTYVPPNRPAKALVFSGFYRYSRNPMYIGITAVYIGLALVFQSFWVILLLVPIMVYIRCHVIAREEAYLERKFGEQYLEYKRKVRRWI